MTTANCHASIMEYCQKASTKACTEALTKAFTFPSEPVRNPRRSKTSKLITTNLNPMRTSENHNENQHENKQNITKMNENQTGRLISNKSKNVPMP